MWAAALSLAAENTHSKVSTHHLLQVRRVLQEH